MRQQRLEMIKHVWDAEQVFQQQKPLIDDYVQCAESLVQEKNQWARPFTHRHFYYQYCVVASIIAQHLGENKAAKVVDWGGQWGQVGSILMGMGYSNVENYVVQEHADFPANRTPTTYNADKSTLPYESESLDALISCGVLEHVREHDVKEEESLAEIFRVLKPGGRFFIFLLPNRYSALENLYSLMNRSVHAYKYSKSEIHQLLESAGFDVQVLNQNELLPKGLNRVTRWLCNTIGTRNYYLGDFVMSQLLPIISQHYTIIAEKK